MLYRERVGWKIMISVGWADQKCLRGLMLNEHRTSEPTPLFKDPGREEVQGVLVWAEGSKEHKVVS